MSNFLKKQIKTYLTLENVIFTIILLSIIFYLFFQVVILKTSSPQVAVTTTSIKIEITTTQTANAQKYCYETRPFLCLPETAQLSECLSMPASFRLSGSLLYRIPLSLRQVLQT